MEKYSTIDDVIAQAVIPALGEFSGEFDAEAIAREAFEMKSEGLRCWFEQREGVDFWEVARKHDVSKDGD